MKIMLITAADSIHAVRWADAFINNGHEVHFVTLSGHKERGDKMNKNVHMHYLKVNGFKGYYFNVIALRKLWKKIKPDIVNVHYASGYGLLARLARIHPLVLSVWGSDVYVFPSKSKLKEGILKKNLKNADAIASTSEIMANQVRRFLDNKHREITITPFGVDVNKFSPSSVVVKDTRYFTCGIIKKFAPIYGIENVIKAFGKFYEKWSLSGRVGPIPRLFICGKGNDGEKYKQLRDELGLTDNIEIRGYIPNDELPVFLNGFDVFCLGSLSESFGVSAVEAMSCGLAVIATDADGFLEIIENNKTGIIVPKADIEAMADRMFDLYQDADKRKLLGENARKNVLEKYNWKDNQMTLISLLEKTSNVRKAE